MGGKYTGSKHKTADLIEEITGIPERALHENDFLEYIIPEKMT